MGNLDNGDPKLGPQPALLKDTDRKTETKKLADRKQKAPEISLFSQHSGV
jgi:hypothetical protein